MGELSYGVWVREDEACIGGYSFSPLTFCMWAKKSVKPMELPPPAEPPPLKSLGHIIRCTLAEICLVVQGYRKTRS